MPELSPRRRLSRAPRRPHAALALDFADASSAVLRVLDPGEMVPTLLPRRPGTPRFLKGDHACAVSGELFTLGRSLDNSAVLLDPAVSREHAYFLRDEDVWRAV